MRVLFLLLSFTLLAKEVPRTMATRHVVNAKEFKTKRAKAMETLVKKKKKRTKRTRDPKAQWGASKVRTR